MGIAEVARSIGLDSGLALQLFYEILERFQTGAADKVFVEGFGTFFLKDEPLREVRSPVFPSGVAVRGGFRKIEFRMHRKTREFLNTTARIKLPTDALKIARPERKGSVGQSISLKGVKAVIPRVP